MTQPQSPTGVRKVVHWLRPRLRKVPLVGTAARYTKRLIVLPWNFHKQYQQQVQVRAETLDHLTAVRTDTAAGLGAVRTATTGGLAAIRTEQREGFQQTTTRAISLENKLDSLAQSLATLGERFGQASAAQHASVSAAHEIVTRTAHTIQEESANHSAMVEILFNAITDRLSNLETRFVGLDAAKLASTQTLEAISTLAANSHDQSTILAGLQHAVSDLAAKSDLSLEQLPVLSSQVQALQTEVANASAHAERTNAQLQNVGNLKAEFEQLLAPRVTTEQVAAVQTELVALRDAFTAMQTQLSQTHGQTESLTAGISGDLRILREELFAELETALIRRTDKISDQLDASTAELTTEVRGLNDRHAAAFDLLSDRLRDQTAKLLGMTGEFDSIPADTVNHPIADQLADLAATQLELAKQIAELKSLIGAPTETSARLRLRA